MPRGTHLCMRLFCSARRPDNFISFVVAVKVSRLCCAHACVHVAGACFQMLCDACNRGGKSVGTCIVRFEYSAKLLTAARD